MAADLYTSIVLKGTNEELFEMLKVLKKFETENFKQYKERRDCAYIEGVRVHNEGNVYVLNDLREKDICEFLENMNGDITVSAGGPWGVFAEPCEVGIFEALADAAPGAYFKGGISGFVTGADVAHNGELKEGKLYLSSFYMTDECLPELYAEYFMKKLSRSKFCRLFKVDAEEFDAECYYDFIMETLDEGALCEMDYDTFMEFCDCSEIDEDKYEIAIEKLEELEIDDFETFEEALNTEEYTVRSVYDPSTKTYRKGSGGTKCENITFVVTGKVTEFKNRQNLSEYIESQGGKVSSSVSKNTNYLINNDVTSESSKNKKAAELGVAIITESEFIEKFGKN